MIVVLDRRPYSRLFKRFFNADYGLIDIDETIECLCRGLTGTSKDYTYIRDLVYLDILFQGHHLFSKEQEFSMLAFFGAVKAKIIEELSEASNIIRPDLRLDFIERYSPMNLSFRVWTHRK